MNKPMGSSKPNRKGQFITAWPDMTPAKPLRAASQGGDIVGGFPVDLGHKGGGKSSSGSKPAKRSGSRKKMY